ncbi:MAG TPA: hypothetical protein VFO85_16065, partial [Vicinamibacteria bacterium]|nr:hypothetical protein [Vicinamibacteria bacterium]
VPRPAASMDRAEQLFADGRFASALAEARAVLEAEPGNSEARQLAEDAQVELVVDQRLKEARSALAAGDRDRARAALQRGLDVKPTDSRLVALRKQIAGE